MDIDYARRIVEVGNITYEAKASPGTAYTQAAWKVRKIDETTPGDTKETWADGNDNYDNVATNLAGLTYA